MSDKPSPFHEGELAIQSKVGVAEEVEPLGRTRVRPFMPEQHRRFFEKLPFIVLGLLDRDGRPWATAAFGPPGFIECPDERTLKISNAVLLAERLSLDLRPNSKLGAIGIELPTGRRNRVNGMITHSQPSGLTLGVEQSFGNCARYIRRRKVNWKKVEQPVPGSARIESSSCLTPAAQALIERAEIFFIASRSRHISKAPSTGVDVSHRGGDAGVVQVLDERNLKFCDLPGNNFFNTLGNIHDDGRVGLLFPEASSNSAVLLTGRAVIEWGEARSIVITVDSAVCIENWMSRGPHSTQRTGPSK